jgi:hypothetical protein
MGEPVGGICVRVTSLILQFEHLGVAPGKMFSLNSKSTEPPPLTTIGVSASIGGDPTGEGLGEAVAGACLLVVSCVGLQAPKRTKEITINAKMLIQTIERILGGRGRAVCMDFSPLRFGLLLVR